MHLETATKSLGLEKNRSKCEVVGHTKETQQVFAGNNIILSETSRSTITLLGAPLTAGQHLDSVLAEKRQELQ